MKIYISKNNSDSTLLNECSSLDEAKKFINNEIARGVKVDAAHSCTSDVFNSASVCRFEVYEDDMVTVFVCRDGDEVVEFNDPIYTSDYYYTDTMFF